MSWASVAKAKPKAAADSSTAAVTAGDGLQLLVVDANAIIDGVRLEGIADRAVTIQEVLDEIRDKQSRQFLATLPYQLEVSEPAEESLQAVTRFARATGDVAALSAVDLRLLALAHTLEVAAHGSSHLASHPNQARVYTSKAPTTTGGDLPGWGSVPNPEDWTAVDEANEADEAALLAASTSRIARHIQQLTLDPSAASSPLLQEDAATAAAAAAGPAAPLTPPRAAAAAGASAHKLGSAAAAGAGQAGNSQQQQQEQEGRIAAADEQAGDEDGWEVAASSKGAARHKKRKEVKRAQQQQAFEQEWAEHSQLVKQQQQQEQQQQQGSASAGQQQQRPEEGQLQAADAAAAAAGAASGQPVNEQGSNAVDASTEELLAEQHQVYTADDLLSPQQQQQQQAAGPGSPGWQSSVAIITGDFAMQNVLLQMGLRLLTKDGRRIARLSRYVLRCSGCFTVTREPGRLFCPKCGNMTLDRVEVVVGPDGAEYCGVTKRHILRGTRYSLPKPKGGRHGDDLVLREDVFLQKVKALGKKAVKKAAGDGDDAAVVDPFAPEYSSDTWHTPSQQELAQHRGLAAVLQPAWKNNPNERKLTRSNRRG